MKIFTREELQTRLMLGVRARDSEITYFGPGPLRAFLFAISTELQHLYYRLFRVDLKQDATRALGSDLDEIGASRGLTRLTASPSSVVLQFTGTAGTIIPTSFQVKSTTGVVFVTTEGGTIAANSNNPGANSVLTLVAQSSTSGSGSAVGSGTVTQVVSFASVTGGTLASVTNLSPSAGGADAETDDQFRARIVNYLASLNHGTRAFYEAQVRALDSTVVRVIAGRSLDPHTVKLLVASRSGASYSNNQLTAMSTALGPLIPVLTQATVANVTYTQITVTITGTVLSGYVIRDVADQIGRNISQYLNWSTWPIGADVQWANLLSIAENTPGVGDIKTFSPNTDTPVLNTSLPKLVSVVFTDSTTNQKTTLGSITSDFPLIP